MRVRSDRLHANALSFSHTDAGVVGTCGELCGILAKDVNSKVVGEVCNILCDVVGVEEFVKLIEK